MAKTTSPEETALIKRWVETWKFAGPELERLKKEELRALTDEEGLRRAILVMNTCLPEKWIDPRRVASSGLIEQQRIFARLAKASK